MDRRPCAGAMAAGGERAEDEEKVSARPSGLRIASRKCEWAGGVGERGGGGSSTGVSEAMAVYGRPGDMATNWIEYLPRRQYVCTRRPGT